MKQVTVRFFAAFRDAAGVESERVSSAAGTLGELFKEVASRHPGLAHLPLSMVAVDDTMARWDDGFEDGAEVLFFPPVAGG